MLQSQKRQVRQFLSSSDVENDATDSSRNEVSVRNDPSTTTMNNLLAPPPPTYLPLTASAPEENYSTQFNLRDTLEQGIITFETTYRYEEYHIISSLYE